MIDEMLDDLIKKGKISKEGVEANVPNDKKYIPVRRRNKYRKLTQEQAIEIRNTYYSNEEIQQKELASKYDVSVTTIRNILFNKHYKY